MFENRTDYDETLIRDITRFSCRTRKRIQVIRGVLFVCAAVGLGMALLFDVSWGIRALAAVVGVLILLEAVFYDRILFRTSWKSTRSDCGERLFSFLEDRVECRRPGGIMASYPYSAVSSLWETEDYFIPMIGGTRHAALRKDGFTRGSTGDFRAFIEQKTGKTFRQISIK